MKKVISVFLLLLVLLIGIHPVLAMHFCGGELRSFEVLNTDIEKSCCKSMEMPQQEDEQSHWHDVAQHSQKHKTQLTHKGCCKTQTVELSTGDYQHQIQHFNLSNILPSFENVWLGLNFLFYIENENTVKTNQDFSPIGFSPQKIELLTYICIFRI